MLQVSKFSTCYIISKKKKSTFRYHLRKVPLEFYLIKTNNSLRNFIQPDTNVLPQFPWQI